MAKKAAKAKAASGNGANLGFEAKLWLAADKLRSNMDAAEYKHVVLGLILLKYVADAFEELHQKLLAGKGSYKGSDPEDVDAWRGHTSAAPVSSVHLRESGGRIFKDPMTTAAAIDRLVHHSVMVELNLPSYRLEQAKQVKTQAAKAD